MANHRMRIAVAATCFLALTGCGVTPTASSPAASHLQGSVHGGQQPLVGTTVQLYAVGTTGDRTAATPLIQQRIVTGATGGFDITGAYHCPSASTPVYLVGTGGDPGTGTSNAAISLMAALGPCGNLSSATYISINELTTVASIFPLASFAGSYASIGSGTADAAYLAAGFAEVNTLVNTASGTAPGIAVPASLSVPVAQLDTLADIVAACVNSPGGTAGDGSVCGNLFQLTQTPGAAAPTNTTDALLAIAANPTRNVASLFALSTPAAPFQPELASAPVAWSAFPTPSLPSQPALLAQYLLTEGAGTIVHDSSGLGNDASLNGPSWEGSLGLNFSNLGQVLQLPTALNAAQSWQFAFYSPTFGHAQLPLAPGYGDPGDFGQNPSILCGTDTAHLCLIPGGAGKAMHFQAFNTDNTQATPALTPGWHIVSLLCGGVNGGVTTKAHILYDGQEVSGYTGQGTATCPVAASGNYQIGGSSQYSGTWFVGKLAAAWAWSTPLTVSQASDAAATALSFIKAKGVVTQFANAGNSTPLVLTGLDSRTYGFGLQSTNDAWPFTMALDQSFTRVNLASSGSTAYDTCIQFDLRYGQQIPLATSSAASGPLVIELWGGVNDFLFTTQTTAQIASSLQCLVQKAKAAGALTVLATEISWNAASGSQGDTNKNSFNAFLRSNAYAWGVDNLADLATDPMLGADGASANTACFLDGLHLSESCEPHVATIMGNAINELLGATAAAPHTTAAATYQEVAGDRYLKLTGTQAQTITLPSCIGYSLPRSVRTGSLAATVAPVSGEVLSGSGQLSPSAEAIFTPTPGPAATAGCTWVRTQ